MRIQQSANNTWEEPHPLGTVQGGGAVGEVVASKAPAVAVGAQVYSYAGWREYGECRGIAGPLEGEEAKPRGGGEGALEGAGEEP